MVAFWGFSDGEQKQFGRTNADAFGEDRNFKIRYPAGLVLDFCQGVTAQVPTDNVELGREGCLREALVHAQFAHDGANNVPGFSHVPNLVLDRNKEYAIVCAAFSTELN